MSPICTTNLHDAGLDLVEGSEVTGKVIGRVSWDEYEDNPGYVLRIDETEWVPNTVDEVVEVLAREGYELDSVSRGQVADLAPAPREDPLRAAIRLAYETAQQDLSDIRQSFASDVAVGAVRAARLWARKAMKAETTESVWNHAMTTGYADGDWDAALVAAEQHAVHLLKESVHPTRNAVDKALNEVQGRTAAELLDTIESFRNAVQR